MLYSVLTLSSSVPMVCPYPAPLAMVDGSIGLMARQYTNPANQERLNTSLEVEVAIKILSCPTMFTVHQS